MTFESEEARGEYFLARLKDKLPELRQRPGFPVAEDEDILRLSDPPYYTACPNPFLTEFIERHGRRYALRVKAKDRWYVPDPHNATDLAERRTHGLLREFDEYRASTQRRLKLFRLEAVRAGFRRAWQAKDYATIVEVARKIPDDVLQEDPQLLMSYDQASTRATRTEAQE